MLARAPATASSRTPAADSTIPACRPSRCSSSSTPPTLRPHPWYGEQFLGGGRIWTCVRGPCRSPRRAKRHVPSRRGLLTGGNDHRRPDEQGHGREDPGCAGIGLLDRCLRQRILLRLQRIVRSHQLEGRVLDPRPAGRGSYTTSPSTTGRPDRFRYLPVRPRPPAPPVRTRLHLASSANLGARTGGVRVWRVVLKDEHRQGWPRLPGDVAAYPVAGNTASPVIDNQDRRQGRVRVLPPRRASGCCSRPTPTSAAPRPSGGSTGAAASIARPPTPLTLTKAAVVANIVLPTTTSGIHVDSVTGDGGVDPQGRLTIAASSSEATWSPRSATAPSYAFGSDSVPRQRLRPSPTWYRRRLPP